MKNRKLTVLVLGTILTFSISAAGCAGKEPGEVNSAMSQGQESTAQEQAEKGSTTQEDAEQGAGSGQGENQNAETLKTGPEGNGMQEEDEPQFSNLNEFQALALDGSTVTQDDFADKDITVINFWALSCGPCLAEMPDLAALGKALPDNVQLMTVCLDGRGSEEYVEFVLEQTGFEGITLLAGDGDLLTLCQELQYTPTTVLVDSKGNTVGEAIIGGKENLAEFYTACINSALTDMGKDEINIDTESEAK